MSDERGPRFSSQGLTLLRAISAILFLFFTSLLIYTCATDGSPFRSSLLTPWMVTTLFDFYLVALPFYGFVCWRHRRSPGTASLVVISCVCLGSSSTWLYLLLLFCGLRAGDPVVRLFMGPP